MIIQAQGDAMAAELIGKQVQKNPAYIELKRIDAAKHIAETMRKNKKNNIFLDSNQLLLNISEPMSDKLMAINHKENEYSK